MRLLATLLALLGLLGVVFGVLTMLQGSGGPHGVPFHYENYGGPGSILAGLVLIAGGLYLRTLEPRQG